MALPSPQPAPPPVDTPLETDPHVRTLEPFVFFHIPKTAGATVRNLLLARFDEARIFPGRNFDTLGAAQVATHGTPGTHGAFLGHMTWDTVEEVERLCGRPPTVFTIVRAPLSHFRSQFAFLDKLLKRGVRETVTGAGETQVLAETWTAEAREDNADQVFNQTCALLIGRGWGRVVHMVTHLDGAERSAFLRSVDSLVQERLAAIQIVGDFEHLQDTMNLVAWQLRLPCFELPARRLNASGADASAALSARQQAAIGVWEGLAEKVHAAAAARAADGRRQIQAAMAPDRIAETLNARYRDAVYAAMELHGSVDLAADRAWPGHGWGIRRTGDPEGPWYDIATSRRGVLFCRLIPQDYVLTLHFPVPFSAAALDRIRVRANGRDCPRLQGRFAPDGAYLLEHAIPAAAITAPGYSLDVEVALPGGPARKLPLPLTRLTILPRAAQGTQPHGGAALNRARRFVRKGYWVNILRALRHAAE